MTDSFSPMRRRLLRSAVVLTGGSLLSGCVRNLPTYLPEPSPEPPLTIDVHTHFFNGTDLQMKAFLSEAVDENGKHFAGEFLSSFAQSADWNIAPTGRSEKRKLESKGIKQPDTDAKRNAARTHASVKLRQQMQQGSSAEAMRKYGKTLPRPETKPPLKGGEVEALDEYFQYRYVALFDYLNLYNQGAGRTMDLVIAHLVDYDWPLNAEAKTKTSLHDQVKLMQAITAKSRGRVHTFAPFCPFREIAHRAGLKRKHADNWSSLQAVQDWVTKSGCIGVKIYPTMGFAPYGNAQIKPDFWDGAFPWIKCPASIRYQGGVATLGELLDQILDEFYQWCVQEDVPVMAHTDRSNGLNSRFNQLTDAEHWSALYALPNYGELRLNFGHLGDFEQSIAADWRATADANSRGANAQALVGMMSTVPKSPGSRYFGDSAYTELILTPRNDLGSVYAQALAWQGPGQSQPLLQDRLMYGSDWSLLMVQENMQTYFADFVAMFERLDTATIPGVVPGTLSKKFFADNAVNYLGLRDGQNFARLKTFYANLNMDFGAANQPIWAQKMKF